MKRLEISRLMDEYVDDEFFPQGGETADIQAVKDRVLAKAAPAKRRRMPRWKTALIAAALAVALVLLVGAGFPEKIYRLVTGTVGFREDTDSRTIYVQHSAPLIELKNGRLFFVLDGQRTDITGQISEETPYIYEDHDPEQDLICHSIILGGTPEYYGWFEWITVPDPFTPDERFASLADENGIVSYYTFAFVTVKNGISHKTSGSGTGNPDWRMFDDFNEDAGFSADDFRWLHIAADKLGIPFIDSTGETVTTIHG